MNFQIMQQVAGKEFAPVLDRLNRPMVFSCPKKAAEEAARLTMLRGVKFQPRPVKGGDEWKAREQKRFTDGLYKPVQWVGQEWFDKNVSADHFLHVSVKDSTRIAFTKNANDGSKDIQTAMKPGKYLTEFFSKILTPEQIRAYSMEHSVTFENKELKFAKTPEEIEAVYKPSIGGSCFSGTTKANLYGSGDFAVAYIEGADGSIKARAVCCPERKIFVHPYGDRERLARLLEKAGFRDTEYDSEPWSGLRLLKAWHWKDFYSDFGGGTEPDPAEPEKYLVIS